MQKEMLLDKNSAPDVSTGNRPEDSGSVSFCRFQADLEKFLRNESDPEVERIVVDHIQSCSNCRRFIDDFVRRKGPNAIDRKAVQDLELANAQLSALSIKGFDLIGEPKVGGHGVVYKAREIQVQRNVAIKMLRNGAHGTDSERKTLLKEAQAVARLSHPHIVQLYHVQIEESTPALIFEWVENGNLCERLAQKEPTIQDTIRIISEIAKALAYAHHKGVMHRDIKPSNIMLGQPGFSDAKLTDFGLAKSQTENGDWSTVSDMVGTPAYMSPEAISPQHGVITTATDIYSLGAIFYLMLCGRVPFQGQTPMETAFLAMEREVIPPSYYRPSIPVDLETICLKCLSKNPLRRYSANELLEDLNRFVEGRSIIARRDSSFKKATRWAKRNPWLAGVSTAFVATLMVTVLTLSYLLQRAMKSETLAEERLEKSVQSFEYFAPLVKRIVNELPARPEDISIINKIVGLCEGMNVDVELKDLRQRFELYYVQLQLADAIAKIKGREQHALQIALEAREHMRKMMAEYETEMRNTPLYRRKDGTVAITLLDRARIGYGHACSQIGAWYTDHSADNAIEHRLRNTEEAIRSAKAALVENPSLNEATGDLANYYFAYIDMLISQGRSNEIEPYVLETVRITEKLFERYLGDEERARNLAESYSYLKRCAIMQKREIDYFDSICQRLWQSYLKLKNIKSKDFSVAAKLLLNEISEDHYYYLKMGQSEKALEQIDLCISELKSMVGENRIIPQLYDHIINLEHKSICIRSILKHPQKSVQKDYEDLVAKTNLILNKLDRKSIVLELMLFPPFPELLSLNESKAKLEALAKTQSEFLPEPLIRQYYSELIRLGSHTTGPIPDVENTQLWNYISRSDFYLWNWKLFKADALIRLGELEEAKGIIDSVETELQKTDAWYAGTILLLNEVKNKLK